MNFINELLYSLTNLHVVANVHVDSSVLAKTPAEF
jgi:hypothetical protein